MVVMGGGMQGRPGAITQDPERQNSKELGWCEILSMSKIWVNSTWEPLYIVPVNPCEVLNDFKTNFLKKIED